MEKSNKKKSQAYRKSLVSVVIPTYNEEDVIGRLLESIKRQTFRDVQVIVVDDGSQDKTVEIANKYTSGVYKRKHAERSVQRNFGAKKSKGEYLLFLDADMELSSNVIAECVKKIKQSRKIGGIVIPEESVPTNFWEKVKAYERSFYDLEGDDVTDAARFFTKTAFNEAEGYDETITGPEDWDLPETIKKLGYDIERICAKIKHHERINSLYSLVRKKYYYGLKSHRYLKKQDTPTISPKTIYFLRPVFYKNWKRLFSHPVVSIAMFGMFVFELAGGGLGFLVGKVKNK